MNIEADWINYAQSNNYPLLLIVKDLEDQELFPVYFNSQKEVDLYQYNIISESKLKIIKLISC